MQYVSSPEVRCTSKILPMRPTKLFYPIQISSPAQLSCPFSTSNSKRRKASTPPAGAGAANVQPVAVLRIA